VEKEFAIFFSAGRWPNTFFSSSMAKVNVPIFSSVSLISSAAADSAVDISGEVLSPLLQEARAKLRAKINNSNFIMYPFETNSKKNNLRIQGETEKQELEGTR
jgi:hypothetical protein